MGLYIYRLGGAALLDGRMYESFESDTSVGGQALLTVLLASVAAAIGATAQIGWRPGVFLVTIGVALATWLAWAMLMFMIGTRILPGPETETSPAELLRTTGFAAAPGMLQVLAAFAPAAALPIFAATTLWMVVAMVIAVKHALDYRRTGRAIAVVGVAALFCLGMAAAIALAMAGPAS